MSDRLAEQTIRDFGEQWTTYTDNAGYYASRGLLEDVFGPLLSLHAIRDCKVADIGAGTGRFVRLFAEAGAAHITAVEPSAAMRVLRENTRDLAHRITYIEAPGDQLPPSGDLDCVFSIGVLHHVPNPLPVLEAARRALRSGGTVAIWLYGKEGNRVYLFVLRALLTLTRRLPHAVLAALVWLLYGPLWIYMQACRVLPLPLAKYMREILLRFDPARRRLVLYDQLNPAYAKYYTREEARSLVERAGFDDVRVYHRHGYSWAVTGRAGGGGSDR
jgi:SAM-dependent methyltransferase